MGILVPLLPAVGAAIPDLALGIVYLVAWVAPQAFGVNIVPYLMLTMLLEFIIIHSSAFMGNVAIGNASKPAKLKLMIGLGAFYTLFVAGFAAGFKTWWPLASFWGLMLNRMLGQLLGQAPDGEEKAFLQRGWAVSVMCYLLGVFVTTLAPIPRLGLVGAFRDGLPGSGLWVSQPQRVVAFGFIYFTLVGLSELAGHRWLPAAPGGAVRPAAASGAATGADADR